MRKKIVIGAMVLIIILALFVWASFFFLSKSNTDEGVGAFADFTDTTAPGSIRVPEERAAGQRGAGTGNTGTADAPQTLRQLTTNPVAGAAFTNTGAVRYVERGTGHIFEVELASRSETQVTNTTFGNIVRATLAPGGSRVIYETVTDNTTRVSISTIVRNDAGSFSLRGVNLPTGAYEAGFDATGEEVRYLLPTDTGAEAHAYQIAEAADRILFTIPFQAARAAWEDPVLIWTRPASSLLGYVYRIEGGALTYLKSGGYGQTALPQDDGVITTEVFDGDVVATAYIGGDIQPVPIMTLPEKCTDGQTARTLVCAAPTGFPDGTTFPDAWYSGDVALRDLLWLVDIENGSAEVLADPLRETGRAIDVSHIAARADGSTFLLINKNDNTLWLFTPSFPAPTPTTGAVGTTTEGE